LLLRALDPLVLHLSESLLGRRSGQNALSFGESLDGTRDVLLAAARELTDLLAVVPAARALRRRFRLARVHVLAAGPCVDALASRPEIFEVVPWTNGETPLLSRNTLHTVRDLHQRRFDLAIAIDGGDARRERVLVAWAGAKLRLGMHPAGADPTLNLVVAAPRSGGYSPVQSLEFLSFLGIPREHLTPSWEIPEADHRYAERLLDLRRKGREGWLLGVDPGRGRGGVRPHPAKLAWLIERLAGHGAIPMILTDGTDPTSVAELRTSLKVPVLEAPSRGIRDVLSFLGCCGLLLSGNTSLFHFGVALGVPTVGLFGREEEDRWVPRDRLRCRVLRLSPGERVREADFLETVATVRDTAVAGLPRGVSAPPPEHAGAVQDVPARADRRVAPPPLPPREESPESQEPPARKR